MKKYLGLLLFAFAALAAYAQEATAAAPVPPPAPVEPTQKLGDFTFDGFVRTGFIWRKAEEYGQPTDEEVFFGSLDDSGYNFIKNQGPSGRARMNFTYSIGNVGIKGRLQLDYGSTDAPGWPYLFGYINAFEDQLTLSMGRLGASPWGTGGPEMWKELESIGKDGVGMRVEYKPKFVPGLNAGFVLNRYDSGTDGKPPDRKLTFEDIMRETVLGVSYEHEYFLARLAYRLDCDYDSRAGDRSLARLKEGDSLVYRAEERIIKNYLPGAQVWAMGYIEGIGAEEEALDNGFLFMENWLFLQYGQDWGTAQFRLGYLYSGSRGVIYLRPNYYHNFLNKLITVGALFSYANDFGDGKINDNAPYTEIQLEPKLQINFPNAYVAFTYNLRQTYSAPQTQPKKEDLPLNRFQTINIRFGMTF